MVQSLSHITLQGRRILVRVDFNVPLDENSSITDDTRIVESLPTIKYIIAHGGIAILMSHLGRPKGKVNPKYSLAPVAEHLADLLSQPVYFAKDCIGDEAANIVRDAAAGDVILLENLRFYAEEEANDPAFAQKLASLGDVYVNDAFGTAHRAHASTEGVTHFIREKAAGFLMQKELQYLGTALAHPERPFVAILGGSKVSGKIDVIRQLLPKCDAILIGGGMMFTFYKAMGLEVGKSLVEHDRIALAGELIAEAASRGVKLLLPIDTVVADSFSNDALRKNVAVEAIGEEWMGMDIGSSTQALFMQEITSAKTVVWNGPMGVFEMPNFAHGTRAVADALVAATQTGATTIIGGGDSAAAITQFHLEKEVTHVSTGGGASLEFLEGKVLPGVQALEN